MDALVLILTIFSAFVLGAAGSYIMGAKGRSQGLGFVLGFFLGALGVLIVLGMENRLHRKPLQANRYGQGDMPQLHSTAIRYPNERI